ncbi:MAG: hypothetical protein Q7U51_12500 [Methanoregula sp.]|nr:hypothetical protein [Methanoregula sp.]
MIDDLLAAGLIRKLPIDRKKVDDALAHAHRDLITAGTIIANDQDWAYTIAYNAVLQAGRAHMFLKRLPARRGKPACRSRKICGIIP